MSCKTIEHCISNDCAFEEDRDRLLFELRTMRAEAYELRKLIDLLGSGSMATAGRNIWHELHRHVREDRTGIMIKSKTEIEAEAWRAVVGAHAACNATALYMVVTDQIARLDAMKEGKANV